VLVCHLPAVVTIGAVIRADEPVAHKRGCIPGLINLSQRKTRLTGPRVSRIHAAGTFHGPYREGDFWI
jgi:hypothetical protein